ncbi:MAG: metallophosphoesterase [Verrucomicrobiota bacterium]
METILGCAWEIGRDCLSMPLHLSRKDRSRRDFIRSVTGGVLIGTWAASAREGGGDEGSPEERWALLADTHIDADAGLVVRETCMAETFSEVVGQVVAEAEGLGLDGVVIDGDCAYNVGLREDYETLVNLLEPLVATGVSIHMTLGNHDDRERFYEVLESGEDDEDSPVAGKHVSVIEGRVARWVLMDSLWKVNEVPGEMGGEQLGWLKSYLEEAGEGPVILVGHHYPEVYRDDVIGGEEKIEIAGLMDGPAFMEMVAGFTSVKAYVYGHSHDWGLKTGAAGLHRVNLPPTSYVFKEGRPRGWVLATVGRAGMQLELRELGGGEVEIRELGWR